MIYVATPPPLIIPKPAIIRAWGKADIAREAMMAGIMVRKRRVIANVATTFIAAPSSTADATTHSFNVNFGAAGLYSHVFIGAAGRSGGGGASVASLTVDSNGASQRAAITSSGNHCSLWNLAYSAGGTVAVDVNWSSLSNRGGIVVWGVTGLLSLVPTAGPISDTGDPVQAAIDIAAGGVVFVIAGTAATTSGTAVGSGFGEDADYVIADGTAHTVWGGHGDFSVAQTGLTVGCDFSSAGTAPIMCGAAFR